jgi:ribosome production factor 2
MQDCSLFVVGTHQKKRPHNLVMGRVFNGHVLDMFEFGVEGYKSIADVAANLTVPSDLKPILVF